MDPDRKVVRLGVFIPTECQLLDASCADILASMSYEYVSLLTGIMPKAFIGMAPSVAIHYIGTVKPGEAIPMTANHKVLATNHFSDDEVAPGKLDIVVVPGPDPSSEFNEDSLEWLRRQGASPHTDILSVCTGIFVCGSAGLLKGRTVCGPRGMQDVIREKFGKDIVQKGSELRWVQDGNFWSSGGVTNGNDLVAAYARSKSDFFPKPLVEVVLEMTDVGDRAQVYDKSQSRFIVGMVFQTFRAWVSSFWRR
ncbi:ThiJ/PfpI family protein [Pestalotiopsis sp. NC0098]|nr:ThiJ/PfpI family protein [Pestalotiopsis sp. NC0098]